VIRLRTVAAFLIAPLVPAGLLAAGVTAAIFTAEDVNPDGWGGLAVVVRIACLASYTVTLLLGLPAFVVFRRRGWTSWRAHAAAGVAIGVVAWGLFRLAAITRPEPSELVGVAIFVGFAVPSTLAFRAVAGRRQAS
jgi:hypothetical protein